MLVKDGETPLSGARYEFSVAGDSEAPPSYEYQQPPRPTAASTRQTAYAMTSRPYVPTIPSNFVSIIREHKGIKEPFLVDPDLSVPETSLSPLQSGKTRKNLFLSTHHGSIDTDVWLAAPTPSVPGEVSNIKRSNIEMKSHHGRIWVSLYGEPNHLFNLSLTGRHTTIKISIPRHYAGPLTFDAHHGKLKLSPELQQQCATLSEERGKRDLFIGDYTRCPGTWTGSAISIHAHHTTVHIRFNDEQEEEKDTCRRQCLLTAMVTRLCGSS